MVRAWNVHRVSPTAVPSVPTPDTMYDIKSDNLPLFWVYFMTDTCTLSGVGTNETFKLIQLKSLKTEDASSMSMTHVPGTHCLDGSPAGYYSRLNASSTSWVIEMQGGGACSDEVSCKSRANQELGSSSFWPATISGSGFNSEDLASNPDFYLANHVHIPYGSGDCHSGNQSEATNNTWGLFFQGSLNFQAIIEDLQSHGIGKAKHVLLTGGSAGGIGTLKQVDNLAKILGPTATVKGAPDAGWFFPAETGDIHNKQRPGELHRTSRLPPSDFADFAAGRVGGWDFATIGQTVTLWNSILHPACAADQENPLVCWNVDSLYPYITSPLFIIESQFDTNQIHAQELAPTNNSDPHVLAYYRYYGAAMNLSLNQVATNKKPDGMFFPSCLAHGVKPGVTIEGATYPRLVGDWFWERNELPHRVRDSCDTGDGLPCNPSCPGASPPPPVPAGACESALERLCGKTTTKAMCIACAEQHTEALADAGCTNTAVRALCGGARMLDLSNRPI